MHTSQADTPQLRPASDPDMTCHACPSCGADGQQSFCPACGQRRFEGRHTLARFAQGALTRLLGEEGVVYTAMQLTLRPGRIIRDYLAGRTVRYVNPVGYLLVATAAFVLVGRAVGGSTGAAESDRILAVLVIPLVAAASRLLHWRGALNLAEHLILVTYLGSQVLVLLTVLYVGILIVPAGAQPVYALVALAATLCFYLWGYGQALESGRFRAALAGILSMLVGAAMWLVLLAALVQVLGR